MRKIFSVMIMALVLSSASFLVSCGDDKDDPVIPTTQNLESVYENEADTRFVFDIDVDKDSSSIYIYNVVFTIDDRTSPPMNIRIDSPCSVDKTGKVYTYSGSDIIPFMLRGTTPVPVPSMPVTNLTSTVNTGQKTFSIAFDCHGGHYEKSGKLK